MSSLNITINELNRLYYKTTNTVERFNILHEVEETIKELRQSTIDNIEQLEQENSKDAQITLSNTEKEVLDRIQNLIADVSGTRYEVVYNCVLPEAGIYNIYEELALDSLDLVEIVMAIEDEFSVEISDERAEGFKTIQEIINFVTK